MADGALRAALKLAPALHRDPGPQLAGPDGECVGYLRGFGPPPPARAATQAAEVRRALYRLGYKTPYSRTPGDWLAPDPPTWMWPVAATVVIEVDGGQLILGLRDRREAG